MEKDRLLFIDNLRTVLICLVILLHVSITYGGAGSWYYIEIKQPDVTAFALLTFHNTVVQAFCLGLFFLVSGYFTPASYARKGAGRFLKERLLRLGIPLLCYDFVIHPLLIYLLMKVGAVRSDRSFPELLTDYYGTFHVGTGPLWFVETLLIFAVIYTMWRRFARVLSVRRQANMRVPGNIAIAVFAFALGVATFVVRVWFPVGWNFDPLNLQLAFFSQYIALFVAGAIAYHGSWPLRISAATGKLWLTVAAVFVMVIFPIFFVTGGALTKNVLAFLGGLHWQAFAYAIWEQFVAVAMAVGLLWLFRERFDYQNKLLQTMSASAYTAYIIHAPVIVLFALCIRNVTLYPLLKFVVASLIAVPLCFALGNIIRKFPLARRIL